MEIAFGSAHAASMESAMASSRPSAPSQVANGDPLRVLCFPNRGSDPYLNQLCGHLEAAGIRVDEFSWARAFRLRYHVVHIHWPETCLWSRSWWRSLGRHLRLAMLAVLLRLRRTPLVWTLHNHRIHEREHWIGASLFPLWFPRLCTHVIALTPMGLDLARLRYPALHHKPAAVIPHGHLRGVFPQSPEREECRAALRVPAAPFTFVFLGSIRAHNDVAYLVETFRRLPGPDVQLIIAGEAGVGMPAADLQDAARGDPRVHLLLEGITEAEVPTIVAAADLVVTPFSEMLNSGSVMLALSLNRPVLAPRVGALPDLEQAVGPRWLRLYRGALDAAVLDEARRAVRRMVPGEIVDLSAFDWPAIAAATIKLYSTRPRRSTFPRSARPVASATSL